MTIVTSNSFVIMIGDGPDRILNYSLNIQDSGHIIISVTQTTVEDGLATIYLPFNRFVTCDTLGRTSM